MVDIQCVACGTNSATPRAHQNHVCRPPIQSAVTYANPVQENKGLGMASNGLTGLIMCDRCGSIATAKAIATLAVTLNPDDDQRDMGLCPDCASDLHRWMVQPTDPSMRAYKTPYDPGTLDAEPVVDQAETTREALTQHLAEKEHEHAYPMTWQGDMRKLGPCDCGNKPPMVAYDNR